MPRGWIASSERERELARHVEGSWGPSRRETLFKRLAIVAVTIMVLALAVFVYTINDVNSVEESYVVVYSAPTELYIGQLDMSNSAWDALLTATTITLTLKIPDWGIEVTRELSYFNRTSDSGLVDFLRMDPITGQVARDTSGKRVEFTLRIEVVTPSAEVAKLRFLGDSNSLSGTVTNDPGKAVVELTSAGKGVKLVDGGKIEVRNEPQRLDVQYWFLQFTRTRLS